MAKIFKNTTASDIEIYHLGKTVPANDELVLDTRDYLVISTPDAISELSILINDGDIVVNDGEGDIVGSDLAIEYLKYPHFALSTRFLNDSARSNDISSRTVQEAVEEVKSTSQPLDSTLTALAAFNTNGIITQTASDTFMGRTITGTSPISVVNGSGVSGNPTLAHNDSGVSAGSYGSEYQTPVYTVDAKGHVSASDTVITKPIKLNFFQNSATSSVTTTSTSFSSLGIDISNPPAGTYLVLLNCSLTSNVSGIDNSSEIAVYVGGSVVSGTQRRVGLQLSGISLASATTFQSGTTFCIVSVNGSQTISAMWRRAAGSTTHSCTNRQIMAVRVD